MSDIVVTTNTVEVPLVVPVGVPGPRGAQITSTDELQEGVEHLYHTAERAAAAAAPLVEAEAGARTSADVALAAAIEAEGEARDSGDAALQEVIDGLAEVARSGSYNDLSDAPVIAPAAPLIVGRLPPVFAARRGITAILGNSPTANSPMVASRLYVHRFVAPATMSINELAIRISTAGAAGSTCRLGLYSEGPNGQPGALLYDSGDLLIDAVGETRAAGMAHAVQAGDVRWVAIIFSASCTVWGVSGLVSSIGPCGWNLAAATPQSAWAFHRDKPYGPLDADEIASAWGAGSGGYPLAWFS